MNLNKYILTQNDCYKAGKKITVKGIMVHSTRANNPGLKKLETDSNSYWLARKTVKYIREKGV